MEFKKLVRILSVAAIAVWLFCLSFLVSYQVAEKQSQKYTTTLPDIVTNTPITSSNNNITTQPSALSSTAPSVNVDATTPSQGTQQSDATSAPTTQSTPAVKVPSTTAEIVNAYVNGINTLKSTQNFTCLRASQLNVTIDEISGGSVVENVANQVIADNQVAPTTYTFVGGTDTATGATPNSILPPINKQCVINESFVNSATCSPTADGGYTMTIYLNDEAHIYPNEAANLSNIVEVVDTSSLIPSQAKVNYMEIYYSGVYVTANFDSSGRMIYTKNYMQVNQMRGSGSMLGFTMTVVGHGDFYGEYTITY